MASSDEDLEIVEEDAGPSTQHRKSGSRKQLTQHGTQAQRKKRRGSEAAGAGPSSGQGPGGEAPLVFPAEGRRKAQHRLQKLEEEAAKRKEDTDLSLSQQEVEDLVGKVVRCMLFSQYDKPGVPVARTRLNEVITADYKHHKSKNKIPNVIIAAAQARCLKSLGLDMRELERNSTASKKGGEEGGGQKMYVLHSVLPAAVRQEVVGEPHRGRGAPQGLTLVVLALIHLEGGRIAEEALWEWLQQLGVAPEQDHPLLGKTKDAMARMEACRYIVKSKRAAQAGGLQASVTQYEWGECAHQEIGEAGIKAYIQKEFSNQFNKAGDVGEQQPREEIDLTAE